VNLLGDLWQNDRVPDFASALNVPGTRLFLYGKRGARPGRKMGHLAAVGDSTADALERVQRAASRL
jgi:5-(carboxyamino)imidazole ribonucleotide synthase